ncbi:hypothetical protein MFIFM68171_09214 [Madurella fahalii]|uniref:Uncharacterized protein n=1 Tax=Madurella fahalii TaxID=1157608 RepID=A0ABQ0GMT5_9PEZI
MPSSAEETRIKAALEAGSVKFHIKAGNAKWQCTLLDRATHERKKAVRADSSSSVSSTESTMSSSSSSSSTTAH